ncbi:uncharacterized protein BCR38DRAFT_423402 [Pseudomassariella vexata]|uniref:Uncharacterized protein n=1 Tax=Pseudomassariella vexata TaxID=1141098 RepID=A0A1Y2EA84_9PEZI|nr:uncharacterized protein BCR38DRAFT_423402 [Pseudomassariella vexata]ORY68481.1 hypothetical protein BCR38DRAFT_423402 [Pseudomassariella vexata]
MTIANMPLHPKHKKRPQQDEEALPDDLIAAISGSDFESLCEKQMGKEYPGWKTELVQLALKDEEILNKFADYKMRSAIKSRESASKQLDADEIAFYEELKKKGEFHKIRASNEVSDGSTTIHSEKVRDAIESMDTYTDAIQQHSEALRTHMARLSASTHARDAWTDEQGTAQRAKEQGLLETKAELDEGIQQLDAMIKDQAQDALRFIQHIGHMLPVPKDLKFEDSGDSEGREEPWEYDHLLEKLQALGWELSFDDQHKKNDIIVTIARRYANEEVYMLVQGCRASLDSAFREATTTYADTSPAVSGYKRAVEAEMIAIIGEIQSLWDEVVPVAHMAVEKQLLEPILRRIDVTTERAITFQGIVSVYIGACLHYMNARLEMLVKRLETAVYHHHSLLIAFQHAKNATQGKSTNGGKVAKTHEAQDAMTSGSRQPSALAMVEKSLKTFGNVPVDVSFFNPHTTPEKQTTKLNEFVQQRSEKGDDAFLKIHQLFESAIKAKLHESELGRQMLVDCIVADSLIDYEARSGAMRDGIAEESINALRSHGDEIGQLLGKLKLPFSIDIHGSHEQRPPTTLWPMLKRLLQTLEGENSQTCYRPGSTREDTSCLRCIETLKLVDMVRTWGELPEFKSTYPSTNPSRNSRCARN